MRLFLTTITIAFAFASFGQTILPGKFITQFPVDTCFFYSSTLTLNCDNTCIFADSSISAYGKWEVKKDKLILHLDSTNRSDLGLSVIKSKMAWNIVDGVIYPEVTSKRAYNNIPKLYKKANKEVPKLEDYSYFRSHNKDNYFKRVSLISCDKLVYCHQHCICVHWGLTLRASTFNLYCASVMVRNFSDLGFRFQINFVPLMVLLRLGMTSIKFPNVANSRTLYET